MVVHRNQLGRSYDLHVMGRSRVFVTFAFVLAAMVLTVASPAGAAEDSTPPQITAFDITPSEMNTESSDQTLTATMTITDDLSGVASEGDAPPINGMSGSPTQFFLKPLIGTQTAVGMPHRISGDDRNGIYTATIVMPRGSKEGVWTVTHLLLVDKLGNSVWLDSDALSVLLPTAEGLVIANTAQAQQVTIERDWTIATARTSVRFPAGTVVARADDGRFAFYQMTAQEFALDDSIPTTDLDGVPLASLKLGIPGFNLSFSQPVSVSMEVGADYNGYRLSIQSLTDGGAAWANEATCTVVNGRVQFTVNHATRFVANLTKSSVPKPTITRLSPSTGKRGAVVTITGKGFGKKSGASSVKFGATKCTKYLSWSATKITCKVPAKAKFGKLQVTLTTTAGKSNARSFTVKR